MADGHNSVTEIIHCLRVEERIWPLRRDEYSGHMIDQVRVGPYTHMQAMPVGVFFMHPKSDWYDMCLEKSKLQSATTNFWTHGFN